MSNNLVNIDPRAKVGMRIRMKEMAPDEKNPVDEDLEGTIDKIDDIGTLHVKWDDGRYIGVIPNVDKYELLPSLKDQIDFNVFESSSDFKLSKGAKNSKMGKKITKTFKRALSNTRPKSDIKIESEEEIEETMTAGGGGGLAGAAGYSYTAPLNYKKPKTKESVIIKVKDLMNEETSTSAISATVDFLITNLMGWGTLSDMSPPWPSLTKKADNGEKENWWWQKIPTYNGGVITDLMAKTDETWDDDKLSVDVDNDMSVFRKEIDKNPKKYKQSVIAINKGFDLNIDPPHKDWQHSLQSGIIINTEKTGDPIQTFRNRHYSRTLKKEDITNLLDSLLTEVKKEDKRDTVHTAKWDRCVKDVEKRNKKNGTDYKPEAVCTSSIGYKGSIKKAHRRKEDIEETTTFGSVFGGNFPVTPIFAAKKGKHIPSKKPIWKGGKIVQDLNKPNLLDEINKIKWVKGGKFVKIKDKCAKYNNQPWCSQGAIDNPLELSDNTFENIKNISHKTGLSEEYILNKIVEKLGL